MNSFFYLLTSPNETPFHFRNSNKYPETRTSTPSWSQFFCLFWISNSSWIEKRVVTVCSCLHPLWVRLPEVTLLSDRFRPLFDLLVDPLNSLPYWYKFNLYSWLSSPVTRLGHSHPITGRPMATQITFVIPSFTCSTPDYLLRIQSDKNPWL